MIDTGPLRGLRLRTPRLSLRLGSRTELVELGELARKPIVVHELRVGHADWGAPMPVEIAGLEPCLPLFGAG